MIRELIVRPEAEAEVADAFGWYEERMPGLGSDFLLHLDAALSAVARSPERFPVVHRRVRRTLLRRFPYGVFFVVEKSRVVVLAVFHAKRNPTSWKLRR